MQTLDTDTDQPPTMHSVSPTRPRWQREIAAVAILVGFSALLWFMRRRGPAMAMEEAMMLQAPWRVAHGAVQARDFDYFYGPVSLWIPAVIYKLAAPTLLVERAIGAGYLAITGVALYFIGRRWSFWIGLAMGGIAILIGALSITALPIYGSIGFLVAALGVAVSGVRERRRDWAIGLLLAVSGGLRPDFGVWSLVLLVTLTLLGAARLRSWIGFGVGSLVYLVLVVQAGWSAVWRTLVSDGRHVSAERHLPFEVHLGDRGLMVVIGAVVVVLALALGLRRRHDPRGVALSGLAVIGISLFPEYLQRADGLHAVYVTIVPLALLPAVMWEVFDLLAGSGRNVVTRHVAVLGVSAVLLFGVQPKFLARSTARDLRFIAKGGQVHAASTPGGEWYFKSDRQAEDHAEVARAAARIGMAGWTLFVGPRDLSRTTYSDGSFYTLLPQFAQRTRYYDFHPRIAQVYGASLAHDVRGADLLILCDVGFDEDNLSKHPGSNEANQVVRERFVKVIERGGCSLYRLRAAKSSSS